MVEAYTDRILERSTYQIYWEKQEEGLGATTATTPFCLSLLYIYLTQR